MPGSVLLSVSSCNREENDTNARKNQTDENKQFYLIYKTLKNFNNILQEDHKKHVSGNNKIIWLKEVTDI